MRAGEHTVPLNAEQSCGRSKCCDKAEEAFVFCTQAAIYQAQGLQSVRGNHYEIATTAMLNQSLGQG